MSNPEPLFSFILPAYKAQFLQEAIESILNQTYQNLELVIVDDASPEDLRSIVNTFSDTRIRYYRNEQNIGGTDLVKQWNHCLSFATGDYVILAADDDVYDKEFLSESVGLFKKYPEVPLLRGRSQIIDERGKVLNIDIQTSVYLSFFDFLLFEKKVIGCIGNYIFTRKSLSCGFISFPLGWWSDRFTVIDQAESGILITTKVVYSFRISTIHISSTVDKVTIYKKISATNMAFKWLKQRLNSLQFNEEKKAEIAYKQFFQANHMYFVHIARQLLKLKLFDFILCLNKVYLNKMISKKEYFKLLFYYPLKKLIFLSND